MKYDRNRHVPGQIWILAGILALMPAGAWQADADQRPNILFVFTDDHAQHAISAYGSVINQTPHLDRLAREGMLFREVFVGNSICAPSRATLLTGKHSHLNGQLTNRDRFDGEQQTFPKLLREAGYATAMIGKWHLGSDPTGFDHWEILPGQGNYYNPDFLTPDGRHQVAGYVTDIITDKCLRWLEEGRDPDKPFLLMYHHKAPHREWMPGPDHLTLYDDVRIPEPPTLFDDYEGRGTAVREQEMEIGRHMYLGYDLKVPPDEDSSQVEWQMWKRNDYHRMDEQQRAAWDAAYGPKNQAFRDARLQGKDLLRWKYQRYIKDYLRTIASVDDNLGRVLDYLDRTGLAKNTVVIYASDQGFYLGDHGWYDKRFIYEPSLRTPMIVRWPGVTNGRENTDMVSNLDWAPTMLELAGVQVPDDVQGRSLVPLLQGDRPDDWRESVYYHYYEFPAVHMVNRHYGARTARYKIVHFYELKEWELYDLEADPHELNSVFDAPEYAEVRKRMKAELYRLQKHYRDDQPYESPDRIAQRRWLSQLGQVPLEQVVGYASNEQQSRGDLDPSFKPITLGAHAVPAGDGVLIAQGGGAHGFALYLADGVPRFAIRSGGGLSEVAADGPVPLGKPVHLAAIFDDQARMHLYIDGRCVASGDGAIITTKPSVAFHVGRDPSSPVGHYETPHAFQGDLSDIRVYWGTLGQDELRQWARRGN